MRTLLELKVQLLVLEERIKQLSTEAYALRKEIANLACPFKVGDVVLDQRKTFWHIAEIKPSYGSYKMHGQRLKKDGTPGLRVVEMWNGPFELVKK